MRPPVTNILAACTVAACFTAADAARADIDTNTTNNGGQILTGGRGQLDSYGLAKMLMDINNELGNFMPITDPTGTGDHHKGTSAANLLNAIGYIIGGPNGTKFTFDQLAYMPVLQLLGYDDTTLMNRSKEEPTQPPDNQPLVFGPAALSSQSSGSSQSDPPPPTVVPEPTSLALLAPMLLAFRRPRRPKA